MNQNNNNDFPEMKNESMGLSGIDGLNLDVSASISNANAVPVNKQHIEQFDMFLQNMNNPETPQTNNQNKNNTPTRNLENPISESKQLLFPKNFKSTSSNRSNMSMGFFELKDNVSIDQSGMIQINPIMNFASNDQSQFPYNLPQDASEQRAFFNLEPQLGGNSRFPSQRLHIGPSMNQPMLQNKASEFSFNNQNINISFDNPPSQSHLQLSLKKESHNLEQLDITLKGLQTLNKQNSNQSKQEYEEFEEKKEQQDQIGLPMTESKNIDHIEQQEIPLQIVNKDNNEISFQQQHNNHIQDSNYQFGSVGMGASMRMSNLIQQSQLNNMEQINNINTAENMENNTSADMPQMEFSLFNQADPLQQKNQTDAQDEDDSSIQDEDHSQIQPNSQNSQNNMMRKSKRIKKPNQKPVKKINGDYQQDNDSTNKYTQVTTVLKTEIKSRNKDHKKKYRQSRHKNVFKNFGSALMRFIQFNTEFIKKKEEIFELEKQKITNFDNWMKNHVRLERKTDFVDGWTWYDKDSDEVCEFKDALRLLCYEFFENYALNYLMNSRKLDDLEIHLRSIFPFIAGINDPQTLERFKPK